MGFPRIPANNLRMMEREVLNLLGDGLLSDPVILVEEVEAKSRSHGRSGEERRHPYPEKITHFFNSPSFAPLVFAFRLCFRRGDRPQVDRWRKGPPGISSPDRMRVRNGSFSDFADLINPGVVSI